MTNRADRSRTRCKILPVGGARLQGLQSVQTVHTININTVVHDRARAGAKQHP